MKTQTSQIIVIILVLALVVFTWFGKVSSEVFWSSLSMVLWYYFGRNKIDPTNNP